MKGKRKMRIILYAVLAGIVANFCWIKPSPVFGETNKSHLEFLSPYKMAAKSTGLDHDSIENTGNENQPASISGENPSLKRHFISLFVGADYWPNLGKVDPSQAGFDPQQFGQFKTWGYNLELAYHYLATTWFDRDLWIGLDFGFFFNENKGKTTAIFLPSGETFSGEIGSRGMYLTPKGSNMPEGPAP